MEHRSILALLTSLYRNGARYMSRDTKGCDRNKIYFWHKKPHSEGGIYYACEEREVAIIPCGLIPAIAPGELARITCND